VGLAVHEHPFLGIDDQEILSVGNVFALEPGLSYTKRGLAARVEDTLYINNDGGCISITDVPYDLVIPIS
jgi:Xaa-Pro aminopeptidase